MEIVNYSIEKIEDPFGILLGERFEILLEITVPEEDELYSSHGITIKTLWVHHENGERKMSHYLIIENVTNNILEFELEEVEIQLISDFCRRIISE